MAGKTSTCGWGRVLAASGASGSADGRAPATACTAVGWRGVAAAGAAGAARRLLPALLLQAAGLASEMLAATADMMRQGGWTQGQARVPYQVAVEVEQHQDSIRSGAWVQHSGKRASVALTPFPTRG